MVPVPLSVMEMFMKGPWEACAFYAVVFACITPVRSLIVRLDRLVVGSWRGAGFKRGSPGIAMGYAGVGNQLGVFSFTPCYEAAEVFAP